MVRVGKNFVKGRLQANKCYGIVRAFTPEARSQASSKGPSTPQICRRSSGVERAIGNGEVDSSILSGGTINFNDLAALEHTAQNLLCPNCARRNSAPQ